MGKLYLFESGSTKTELNYLSDGKKEEHYLPGYNPNRDNGAFEIALEEGVEIEEGACVYFYGSGLSSANSKKDLEQLFSRFNYHKLRIFDDIIGAARAAFRDKPGIVCIMGTGGLAAFYDGKEIVERKGGHGYLIDDLGGGFDLGRRLLAAWMDNSFSDEANNQIESLVGMDSVSYKRKLYKDKDLAAIADFPKDIGHINDPSIDQVIDQYFLDFIRDRVVVLAEAHGVNNFSVVGSVGMAYHQKIRSLSERFELNLEQCIQSPIQRLFDYHRHSG